MSSTPANAVRLYRQFFRVLRWWPEQREDENCFKTHTIAKVRQEFRRPLPVDQSLDEALEEGVQQYQALIRIGSNFHREQFEREVEHIVPEEAKRAATLLSQEVQEKVAQGRWTVIDRLANLEMPENVIHKEK